MGVQLSPVGSAYTGYLSEHQYFHCNNNGSCSQTRNSNALTNSADMTYSCSCDQYYYGSQCETYCVGGSFFAPPTKKRSGICSCDSGFTGSSCDQCVGPNEELILESIYEPK